MLMCVIDMECNPVKANMELVIEQSFECALCSKKFIKKDHIKNHIKQVHLKQKVLCIVCDKYFHTLSLQRHQKNCLGLAEKKFECTVCNKLFNRSEHLRTHREVHFPKKVQCSVCQKCMNKNYLKKHQRKSCRGLPKEVFILDAFDVHQLNDESRWSEKIIEEEK